MDKTTASVIVILGLIVGFTYVNVFDSPEGIPLEPTHYCESREIKMYCNRLSSTGVTCYPTEENRGYKRCSEGWKEIPREEYIVKRNSNEKIIICPPRMGCYFI